VNVTDGSTLSFKTELRNSYATGVFDQTGASAAMVVRVPQYGNVTIANSGSIIAPPWDGYTGGIVVMRVRDSIVFEGSGHINVSWLGFRGGGCGACGDGDWGQNGEGISGLGSGGGSTQPTNWPEPDTGSNGGVGGYGPSGLGGEPGAGGSYGTAGTNGTGTYSVSFGDVVGNETLSTIMFGGAGGGGGDDDGTTPQAIGGAGAGAVMVFAGNIVDANVYADGEDGVTDSGYGGESGAGAGGTVWLSGYNVTIGSVTALGGSGQVDGGDTSGDGGDGRIRIDSVLLTGAPSPLQGHNDTPNTMLTDENAYFELLFSSFDKEGVYQIIANTTYLNLLAQNLVDFYVDYTTPDLFPMTAGLNFSQSLAANITATVTDNFNVSYVSVNITWSGGTVVQQMTGNYSTLFYQTDTIGRYNVTYYANDSAGNENVTETTYFFVIDNIPPDVMNLTPNGEAWLVNWTVNITANVTDYNGIDTVFANISWKLGFELLEMFDLDGDDIFNLSFSNTSYGGRYNITIIANDTIGLINDTEMTFFVTEHQSYHIFYGDADGEIGLGYLSDILSSVDADTINNVFAADIDSVYDFEDLQALGRTKDNLSSTQDFGELDTLLGLASHTDSIVNLWGADNSTALELKNFTVFGRLIENVPVVNTTDNTSYKTGILWDMSDSADNEFDSVEVEDIVFIVEYNATGWSKYGSYGYEIRVPENLVVYKPGQELIDFMIEEE